VAPANKAPKKIKEHLACETDVKIVDRAKSGGSTLPKGVAKFQPHRHFKSRAREANSAASSCDGDD
jgi:hypothetical protein